MTRTGTGRWRRRAVLRTLGVSLAGATVAGGTAAQSESASVRFEDQESDGESVVVARAETPVDAVLLLVAGRSRVFRQLDMAAGESFTDRTVELTTPIEESTTVRAELRVLDGGDELLANDRALVAVGESLASARSTVDLPSGRAEIIDPDPDAGFRLPYALYRPDTDFETPRPLLVQPLNDRDVETGAGLRKQLRDAVRGGLVSAGYRLGLPALVPGLPRTPEDGGDRIQGLHLPTLRSDVRLDELATDAFPAEALRRVDRQVVRMIADARERLSGDGYPVANTVHMTGFSSSAQFSARFAFLYPSLVNAITVGGNGAYPLPRASMDGVELPYPLGTADYPQITGREFDADRWRDIAQFVYVGREDQPLPESDNRGYYPVSYRFEDAVVEVFGRNRVTERLPVTRSVYDAAGANATVRVYDGVGHRVSEEMFGDAQEFHRDNVDAAADRPAPGELLQTPAPEPTPTPTATPTTTPSPTDTPTEVAAASSSTPTDATTTTAGGGGAGFGIPAAVTALGTGLVLLARRLRRAEGE
jgi:hypothetical protein